MERTKRNIVIGQPVSDVKAERAKELRREQTPSETLLWQQLRRNALDGLHFRRQQPIDGFIVDFYCHSLGLVIELDGAIHREQESYDRERDSVLSDRGLHILRVSNDDVHQNIGGVMRRISQLVIKLSAASAPGT